MSLEHLALKVHATGCSLYSGCHFGRCAVPKPASLRVPGEAIETTHHRIKESAAMTVDPELKLRELVGNRPKLADAKSHGCLRKQDPICAPHWPGTSHLPHPGLELAPTSKTPNRIVSTSIDVTPRSIGHPLAHHVVPHPNAGQSAQDWPQGLFRDPPPSLNNALTSSSQEYWHQLNVGLPRPPPPSASPSSPDLC